MIPRTLDASLISALTIATMIAPMFYVLQDECPVPWNPTAEQNLHADYPFLEEAETDASFIIRRYLETLWLPEVRLSYFGPKFLINGIIVHISAALYY